MSRRFFFIFFFSAFHFLLSGAYLPTDPFIVNYAPEDYGGNLQNWEAVQDKRGVMFFGNTSGILEFDSRNWRLIPTPQQGLARALAIDAEGTIFFGTIGDFGFLQADERGMIKPVSLLPLVKEQDREFNDVWQIVTNKNGVYFLTRTKIFRYFQNRIEVLSGKLASSQACTLNDILFYIDSEFGLSMIVENRIEHLLSFRYLYSMQRICLAPFGKHGLLLARREGDFWLLELSSFWNEQKKIYQIPQKLPEDKIDEIVRPFRTEIDEQLRGEHAFLYKFYNFGQDLLAISTVKKGVFFLNYQGKLIRHLRREDGLLDNTVAAMFCDRERNVWCCTNSGISHVLWNSAQSYFSEKNGIESVSISFWKDADWFYCGTFTGLFATRLKQISVSDVIRGERKFFQPVKNSPPEIWQFLKLDDQLLAATGSGLYRINGDEAEKIPGPSRDCYCLASSGRFKDYVFLGMMGGMDIYVRQGADWKYLKRFPGLNENIRRIVADRRGDLWISTEKNGVFRLRFKDEKLDQFELKRFGKVEGLPEDFGLSAVFVYHRLYFLTPRGIFIPVFDKNQLEIVRFEREREFSSLLAYPLRNLSFMLEDRKGGVIIGADDRIFWVKKRKNGGYEADQRPFVGLPPLIAECWLDPEGNLWFPGKRHIRIGLMEERVSSTPFEVILRVSGKDLIHAGAYAYGRTGSIFSLKQPPQKIITLPFSANSIKFDFAATFFDKPLQTGYQFMLEGFDGQWSDWQQISSKEYTNLSEGDYRFRIRARNAFGQISRETSWRFVIQPPWFRTTWAYLLWVICGAGFLFLFVRIFTWRLRRRKIILEKLVAEKTRQLKELSLTDPLTGLRNRRFISEVLQNDIQAFIGLKKYLLEARDNRRRELQNVVFGVFMFDLDHFKEINDRFGHEAGDLLLKQFADILKGSVRKDDVVIRTGGEEFLVVLKKSEMSYLHQYALRILQKINSSEFDIGIKKITRTCSLGYTSFPVYNKNPDLLTFEQTIMIADLALLYAKEHGRNQAVYIEAVNAPPSDEEIIRKTVTSFKYALNNSYLKIGNLIKF